MVHQQGRSAAAHNPGDATGGPGNAGVPVPFLPPVPRRQQTGSEVTDLATWENHPAKFNPNVLREAVVVLRAERDRQGKPLRVLDPFAGTGRIHWLGDVLCPDAVTETVGVEIEPEGHHMDRRTIVGDATALPAKWRGTFDVMFTSPCYGNRMADKHNAKDACKTCAGAGAIDEPGQRNVCPNCGGSGLSKRNTYRHSLGHDLADNSAAGMQWGPKYRALHDAAWHAAFDAITPGGLAIINAKNFYRTRAAQVELVRVVEYHLNAWLVMGATMVSAILVPTRGNRHGTNGQRRVDHEMLLVVRTPEET